MIGFIGLAFSIIAVLFVIFGVFKILTIDFRKTNLLKKTNPMSWPSRRLLIAYRALPVINRPIMDIEYILTALDIKHGGKDVIDRAFGGTYIIGSSPSWNPYYSGTRTAMYEYFRMHKDISNIIDSINAQEQAIKLAGVAGGLGDVEELTLRLREENDLIKSVTKQLM